MILSFAKNIKEKILFLFYFFQKEVYFHLYEDREDGDIEYCDQQKKCAATNKDSLSLTALLNKLK